MGERICVLNLRLLFPVCGHQHLWLLVQKSEQALGRCGRQHFQGAKGGGGGVCKLEAIEWAPVLGSQETSGGLARGVLAGTREKEVEPVAAELTLRAPEGLGTACSKTYVARISPKGQFCH